MMSCIKFPSSKNELLKATNNESITDNNQLNSQLIAIANQVFGQNNWCHSITNQTLDFIDYVTGKYHAGCATIVKVQVHNGNFHEDIGYSYAEGSSKGSAIQKARLNSLTNALRKTLMCFGTDVTNRINGLSKRSSSPVPVPVETLSKKVKQVDENHSTVTNKIDKEPFVETISMSQTDALLMDTVDLDQLFPKDQNANISIKQNKGSKVETFQVEKSKAVASSHDKKSNIINGSGSEIKVDMPKANTLIGTDGLIDSKRVDSKDSKIISSNGLKKESKTEVSKSVECTVMTEEEMRLERKRKQRERQEEFKRQQEIKKKHVDIAIKQPNPRY